MSWDFYNADGIDLRWLMTNCVCSTLLLLACAVACHAQDTGPLYTFFKQNIGLNDSEIAGIEHGKAVAKILASPTSQTRPSFPISMGSESTRMTWTI